MLVGAERSGGRNSRQRGWKSNQARSVTEIAGDVRNDSYSLFSAASFSSFSGGPNICPRCNKTVYFGKRWGVCTRMLQDPAEGECKLRKPLFLQPRRCRLSARTGTGPVCAVRDAARLCLPAATQRWGAELRTDGKNDLCPSKCVSIKSQLSWH